VNLCRYIFVGNRKFVLEKMLEMGLHVDVVVISGTHLEQDINNGYVKGASSVRSVRSKEELLDVLSLIDYQVLVSNGCPFVLPVSELKKAKYVNIHPSYLPDLRGVDPVIGAVLFARDSGATCHLMDSKIDTGDIIAQVKIPYSDDLDVTTLYQLSFVAEQKVFCDAFLRGFEAVHPQVSSVEDRYYTRSDSDRKISFCEENSQILRKVKAFNNRSQGCLFEVGTARFRVYAATLMFNSFMRNLAEAHGPGVVVLSYENSIVFLKDGELLRFMDVVCDDGDVLSVGDRLF
jgi:methionyl-tRNA formyltransferase